MINDTDRETALNEAKDILAQNPDLTPRQIIAELIIKLPTIPTVLIAGLEENILALLAGDNTDPEEVELTSEQAAAALKSLFDETRPNKIINEHQGRILLKVIPLIDDTRLLRSIMGELLADWPVVNVWQKIESKRVAIEEAEIVLLQAKSEAEFLLNQHSLMVQINIMPIINGLSTGFNAVKALTNLAKGQKTDLTALDLDLSAVSSLVDLNSFIEILEKSDTIKVYLAMENQLLESERTYAK